MPCNHANTYTYAILNTHIKYILSCIPNVVVFVVFFLPLQLLRWDYDCWGYCIHLYGNFASIKYFQVVRVITRSHIFYSTNTISQNTHTHVHTNTHTWTRISENESYTEREKKRSRKIKVYWNMLKTRKITYGLFYCNIIYYITMILVIFTLFWIIVYDIYYILYIHILEYTLYLGAL